jgi:hypothetical protein
MSLAHLLNGFSQHLNIANARITILERPVVRSIRDVDAVRELGLINIRNEEELYLVLDIPEPIFSPFPIFYLMVAYLTELVDVLDVVATKFE